MNKKIIGMLVCMLLIAVAVLQATGIMTIRSNKLVDNSLSSDNELVQEAEEPIVKSEPDETEPLPAGTKTGYLSIPAAAFTPRRNITYVKNLGYDLTGDDLFVAPVYLPQDSTVTNVTYYWRNSASASARAHLSRNNMDGTEDEMTNVWIDGGVSGNGFDWNNQIDFAEINNSKYSYFIELGVLSDMGVYGFIIEYTYKIGGSSEDTTFVEESLGSDVSAK